MHCTITWSIHAFIYYYMHLQQQQKLPFASLLSCENSTNGTEINLALLNCSAPLSSCLDLLPRIHQTLSINFAHFTWRIASFFSLTSSSVPFVGKLHIVLPSTGSASVKKVHHPILNCESFEGNEWIMRRIIFHETCAPSTLSLGPLELETIFHVFAA